MVTLKDPGIIRFDGIIEQSSASGSAGFIYFPHDLKETYGKGNLVPVIVTYDDIEYRGSIAKMGPQPMVLIRKNILTKLGKQRGDSVTVTVSLDITPREVETPAELAALLKTSNNALDRYGKLPYSHKKEWADWISSAKQPETRERWAKKAFAALNESTE